MNRERLWKFWEQFGLAGVTALIALALSLTSPRFLSVDNFAHFVNQAAVVAIAGAGMTFAIAGGAFDLSVGSVLALAACAGARTLIHSESVALSVLVSLAVGGGLGVVNGLIVARLRIPPFIATLGMMTIVRGFVLVFTEGRDINIFVRPEVEAAYKFLGGGRILSVPVPMALMIGVFALLFLLLRHTAFGRHVCALGSNERAAATSGLHVDRIKILMFALVGACAGLAGVVRTAQLMGVNGGTAGLGFELEAIAVVVLGGTSLRGGRGRLLGTMMGAILVAVVNNGLNLRNTPIFYQYLVLGLVLLAAVGVDGLRRGLRATAGSWTERWQ